MGKLSPRLRLTFAVCTILCVLALAISPFKDFRAEWKLSKRRFVKYAQTRPDTKKLLADYHPNIDQIWLPGLNVTDRCTTCHQGISQPSLADSSSDHFGLGATHPSGTFPPSLLWQLPSVRSEGNTTAGSRSRAFDLPQLPKLPQTQQPRAPRSRAGPLECWF